MKVPFRSSLLARLLVPLVLAFLFLFPLYAALNVSRQRQTLIEGFERVEQVMAGSLERNSRTLTQNLAHVLLTALLGNDFAFLSGAIKASLERDRDLAYGAVYGPDGRPLVTETRAGWSVEEMGPLPEVTDPAGITARRLARRDPGGAGVLDVVSTFRWEQGTSGYLRLGFDLSPLERETVRARAELDLAIRAAYRRVAVATGAFLLIAAAIAVAVSLSITRPIRELTAGVDEVARGNLEVEIPVRSRDEVARLAEAFNRMARDLRQLLATEAVKQRMARELEMARELQQKLLPRGAPSSPWLEISADLLTSTEVGGDFYEFLSRSRDGRPADAPAPPPFMLVGDVTGHGVQAGLIVAAVNSAIRTEFRRGASLRELMTALNLLILELTERELLMTCLGAVYEPAAHALRFVNAGHNFIYHYRPEPECLTELEQADYPLGFAPDTRYDEHVVELLPGDLVVLYTDGLVECRNEKGEIYDYPRLEASILGTAGLSAAEARERILGGALRFCAGRPIDDDITLVVAKCIA